MISRKKITALSLLPALLVFTVTQWGCRSRGTVQVAKGDKTLSTVGFGFLENRDIRFMPYTTPNFKSMIEFEFRKLGYITLPPDLTALLPGGRQVAKKKARAAPGEIMLRDLLPPHLRNVAGETMAILSETPPPGRRLLSREEIGIIFKKNSFQFFIQGAIGRAESGPLLDSEESVMVFLDIYSSKDRKIRSINFSVSGRDLQNAPYLKDVCKRIAGAFYTKIEGRGPLPKEAKPSLWKRIQFWKR